MIVSALFTVLFALEITPFAAVASGGVEPALAWLRRAQQPDGGFSSGFAEGSDIGATADAIVAIASGGEDPAAWTMDGSTPLDYLRAHLTDIAGPGQAAKVGLALVAAGEDPSTFGGVDLPQMIEKGFDASTGTFGGGPYDSALAILALAASGHRASPEAVQGLLRARQPDGSYAFDGAMTPGSGDSNTTALAVQALLVAGAGKETVPSYRYFREKQNTDAGWTYQKPSAYGEATDANSTALVIQALLAGGQDLAAWGDPGQALLALQQPSGALAFKADTPGDNLLATVQAVPALAGYDLTDLHRLPEQRQTAAEGSRTVLLVVGSLLIVTLAVAGIVARTEAA
jgi:hypothetical protein